MVRSMLLAKLGTWAVIRNVYARMARQGSTDAQTGL